MNLSEVDPERRADVTLDEIGSDARRWHAGNRRPKAISAKEALLALEFEALIVAVAAQNLANGVELTPEDRARLLLAYQRIDAISAEACR